MTGICYYYCFTFCVVHLNYSMTSAEQTRYGGRGHREKTIMFFPELTMDFFNLILFIDSTILIMLLLYLSNHQRVHSQADP